MYNKLVTVFLDKKILFIANTHEHFALVIHVVIGDLYPWNCHNLTFTLKSNIYVTIQHFHPNVICLYKFQNLQHNAAFRSLKLTCLYYSNIHSLLFQSLFSISNLSCVEIAYPKSLTR